MELAEHFQIDGAQLWLVYSHMTSGMTPIQVVTKAILSPAKKETMSAPFPLISDLLTRLAVLPAGVLKHEMLHSGTA